MENVLFDITERPEVIKINVAVWIETINEVRRIYVKYALFTQYPVSNEISQRYAILNLARSQVVSRIHRETGGRGTWTDPASDCQKDRNKVSGDHSPGRCWSGIISIPAAAETKSA